MDSVSIEDFASDQDLVRRLYDQQRLFVESRGRPDLDCRARDLESALAPYAEPPTASKAAAGAAGGLFVVVTRRCQMRCGYCSIDEYSGDLDGAVLSHALDRLSSSHFRSLRLHFFGGEPLLRFDLIEKSAKQAEKRFSRAGKKTDFAVTTNGILLDSAKVDFFVERNFHVEISCDGASSTQLSGRGMGGRDYYARLVQNMEALRDSGVSYHVVMTVSPKESERAAQNFRALADLGHRKIQISCALGLLWTRLQTEQLLVQLDQILEYVEGHSEIQLMNRGLCPEPMVLNAQPMMDYDGNFYLQLALFFGRSRSLKLGGSGATVPIQRPTQFEVFWRLAHCFDDDPRQRKFSRLILNNVQLGRLVGLKMLGRTKAARDTESDLCLC